MYTYCAGKDWPHICDMQAMTEGPSYPGWKGAYALVLSYVNEWEGSNEA